MKDSATPGIMCWKELEVAITFTVPPEVMLIVRFHAKAFHMGR